MPAIACSAPAGLRAVWHLHTAVSPRCNPQSAQGPSRLQSASIRNRPCMTLSIASGVRTWNCAGPGAASISSPKLPR
eukprot:5053640-Alexandrium_andersonii.AAC.1